METVEVFFLFHICCPCFAIVEEDWCKDATLFHSIANWAFDDDPSYCTVPCVSSWNEVIMLSSFGGHPIFSILFLLTD